MCDRACCAACRRVSPITVLIAMRVYENGSAALKWTRNNIVVEALNAAFASALKVWNPFFLLWLSVCMLGTLRLRVALLLWLSLSVCWEPLD